MIRVRFIRGYKNYRAGDVARLADGLARRLISQKICVEDKSITPEEVK